MKAKIWFEAQGQRMRSHGYPFHVAKRLIGIYSLPDWAQRAFARGHMAGSK